MVEEIYDPLDEYMKVFHPRFREVAERTFAALAEEAQVDVQANRSTCTQVYKLEEQLASVKSRIGCWTVACVLLWLVAVVGAIYAFGWHKEIESGWLVLLMLGVLVSLVLLLMRVHPKLKVLKKERQNLSEQLEQQKSLAWNQMAPLNRLYDWDVLTRMMSETVPRLEFDPYFTTQRLEDLRRTYGWSDRFNKNRSVIYSHSGLINGNPFVICRTRKFEMGSKTYYGSKTIYWTTTERDADGKMRTVEHSETLTAEVTAPYPEYPELTRLIYGNMAAPDLIFYRKKSGLAGNEDSLRYTWNRRSLRKKSRDLSNMDFAMMTNEEFEVVFNTSNRNDNQQFALLFTPLAQETMLRLLRDEQVGYGDDFDFEKNCKINTIIADHMQDLNLDMNPDQYRNFDFEKAKEDFYEVNARYFRAIYFCLAPLLCVPMYQQIRPPHAMYGRKMQRHSAFWEHEALANFWGQERFMNSSCVTDCILKTEKQDYGDESMLTVYAYGYTSKSRVSYISKLGGDGHWHEVPVYWDEYLPVTGTGNIHMMEDNEAPEGAVSQSERMKHVHEVLDIGGMNLYRRHIASKV